MTIDFVLTGGCIDEARTLLGVFCERELSLTTIKSSENPSTLGGKAAKLFFLNCVVVPGTAPGEFLLDQTYGKQRVADLLIEIKKIAMPGDSIAMSVQGRDDLDLKIATPSSVYSAIAHGAKPLLPDRKPQGRP